jgi:hypothetical protein
MVLIHKNFTSSQETELWASRILRSCFGVNSNYQVKWTGLEKDTDQCDVLIFQNGFCVGACEVKGDFDELEQARENFWQSGKSAMLGLGSWMVEFAKDTNKSKSMKETHIIIKRNVELAIKNGIVDTSQWEESKDEVWREIKRDLASCGVLDISFTPEVSHEDLWWCSNGFTYVGPVGVDEPVDWLNSKIKEREDKGNFKRLLQSDTNQKHIFIWAEGNAPNGAQAAAMTSEILPSKCPAVPEGITHVWIGWPGRIKQDKDGKRGIWSYRFAWLFDVEKQEWSEIELEDWAVRQDGILLN